MTLSLSRTGYRVTLAGNIGKKDGHPLFEIGNSGLDQIRQLVFRDGQTSEVTLLDSGQPPLVVVATTKFGKHYLEIYRWNVRGDHRHIATIGNDEVYRLLKLLSAYLEVHSLRRFASTAARADRDGCD